MGILDYLSPVLQQEQQRITQSNPWINAGRGLQNFQLSPNTAGSGWEQVLAQTLAQGLGGLASGYGQNQANNESADMMKQLTSTLASSDPMASAQSNPMLARIAPYLQLQNMEDTQKIAADRDQALFNKGQMMGPNGVENLPGEAESQGQMEFEKQAAQQRAEQAALGGRPFDAKGKAAQESEILKNILASPEYKSASEVDTRFKGMVAALPDDTGASDLPMIYGVAKILDPIGSVREGDANSVLQSQSIPGWLKGMMQSKVEGQGAFTKDQREKLIQAVKPIRDNYIDAYKRVAGAYEPQVQNYGLTRENAIPNFSFDSSQDLSDRAMSPKNWTTNTPEFQTLKDVVVKMESGGNPDAVSPKGAKGLMQLMPGAIADWEKAHGDQYSPSKNEEVGSWYLLQQLKKYNDIPTALAAYNWGPGNVDGLLKDGGTIKSAFSKLPSETQNYIKNAHVMNGLEALMPKKQAEVTSSSPNTPLPGEARADFIKRMMRGG